MAMSIPGRIATRAMANPSSAERVLIVGAGVSGSILAFWLGKHNYKVTVIERYSPESKLGQGIEIEEPALQVVKAMGIWERLDAIKTSELGFNLVDQKNRSYGIAEAGKTISPTGDLELMRGDLTQVLYRAADESPNVTYRFETTIKGLRQEKDIVNVDLQRRNDSTTTTEDYDFVIGADGVKSRTRSLAMGTPEELDCYRPVGVYTCYFDMPKQPQDEPYSRLCNFPGRRIIWTRPISKVSPNISVYFLHTNRDIPALRAANASGDRQRQKELFREIFSGLGWEAPRIVEGMMAAENFYSDDLQQVKLQSWSKGRVALVGDSAWAPTPITGQGNQLAIIGAWVLAQEMTRNRSTVAFEQYEARLRKYVEECQSVPLWGYGPFLFAPQSAWGIAVLRNMFWGLKKGVDFVFWTGLIKWFPSGGKQEGDFDMQIPKEMVERGK